MAVARLEAGFLVLDLPSLVRMKLQSFRRVDQVYLEDLLSNGLIDAGLVESPPDDLRQRLREIQATME